MCERFRFETVAAGDAAQNAADGRERRNSFLRKGRAGDWRGYFDARLGRMLGRPFSESLVRLGYEADDGWMRSLPEAAEKHWDLSRLRARPSLARSFRGIWEADPELQERFPDPTDVLAAGGSYVDHLVASGRPEVMAHRAKLIGMARLWNADVKETTAF